MVQLLKALLIQYRVGIYELAGGGLVVAGADVIGGHGPALIAGGMCFLVKSLEHDMKKPPEGRR